MSKQPQADWLWNDVQNKLSKPVIFRCLKIFHFFIWRAKISLILTVSFCNKLLWNKNRLINSKAAKVTHFLQLIMSSQNTFPSTRCGRFQKHHGVKSTEAHICHVNWHLRGPWHTVCSRFFSNLAPAAPSLLQNPDQTPISGFLLRLFSTPRSTRLYAKIMCIYITTATLWAIIYKKYAHQEVLASLTKGERFFFFRFVSQPKAFDIKTMRSGDGNPVRVAH